MAINKGETRQDEKKEAEFLTLANFMLIVEIICILLIVVINHQICIYLVINNKSTFYETPCLYISHANAKFYYI